MIARRTLLRGAIALAAAGAAALSAGCAHPQFLKAGSTEEQAVAELGAPHARTVMPDGTVRLTYSHQPMGQAVWWVFFDANGRYLRSEQALTEENFTLVKPGMTKKEVYALFGPCAEVYNFKFLKQTAFMYRFEDGVRRAMAFWVDFDESGRAVSWTVSDDPWLDKPLRML